MPSFSHLNTFTTRNGDANIILAPACVQTPPPPTPSVNRRRHDFVFPLTVEKELTGQLDSGLLYSTYAVILSHVLNLYS